jgi:hypothetical protein
MNPLRFQVGASVVTKHFTIDEAPQTWIKERGGVPHCTACGRELHIEWADPRHGTAACRCGDSVKRRVTLQDGR